MDQDKWWVVNKPSSVIHLPFLFSFSEEEEMEVKPVEAFEFEEEELLDDFVWFDRASCKALGSGGRESWWLGACEMEVGIPDSGRSALDGLRVIGVDEPLSRAEISNPGRQKLPKAEGVS